MILLVQQLTLLVSLVHAAPTTRLVPGDYPTIQAAVDAANPGDTIQVSPGVYRENVLVQKNDLKLVGLDPWITIIDGGGLGTVVRAYYVTAFSIEGFTVRNSGENSAAGILFDAYYYQSGQFTAKRNIVQSNSVGIELYNILNGACLLEGNLVTDNTWEGIDNGGCSDIQVVGNTVARNGRDGYYSFVGKGPVSFSNNIFALNGRFGISLHYEDLPRSYEYNDVWGNGGPGYCIYYSSPCDGQATPGDGSISLDPRFIEPLARDYHLLQASPCIDAGTNKTGASLDLDGNPRPVDGNRDGVATTDMGAHEYTGAVLHPPHVPILIEGNSAFTTTNGVTSGKGTAGDPYVISSWDINASSNTGVRIRNTTAYFVLRGLSVRSSGQGPGSGVHDAIDLDHVTHGEVWDTRATSNGVAMRLEGVTETMVEGVDLPSNGVSGILISNSSMVKVEGLRTTDNGVDGVCVDRSHLVDISYSLARGNGSPLEVLASDGIAVRATTLEGNNTHAVVLRRSTNVNLTGNTIQGGLVIEGTSPGHFNSQSIDASNQVNGKPLRYYANCGGNVSVSGDLGELILASCSDVHLSNLHINGATVGVELAFVTNVSLIDDYLGQDMVGVGIFNSTRVFATGNWVEGDTTGIRLEGSSDVHLVRNSFQASGTALEVASGGDVKVEDNLLLSGTTGIRLANASGLLVKGNTLRDLIGTGIDVEGSQGGIVEANSISSSATGIYFASSHSFEIDHNNLLDNAVQAKVHVSDLLVWDAGYPAGGNYWSNYPGVDRCGGVDQKSCQGGDGIGDTPYTIDGGDIDRYPLMAPFGVARGTNGTKLDNSTFLIPVGSNLAGIAVDPVRPRAYVADRGNNRVLVVDMANASLVTNITVGSDPVALAVDPSGTTLYVGHAGERSIVAIDLATLKVIRHLTTTFLTWDLVAPTDNTLVATTHDDQWDGQWPYVLNSIDGTVLQRPCNSYCHWTYQDARVALSPDGSHLYIVNAGMIPAGITAYDHSQGLYSWTYAGENIQADPNGAVVRDVCISPDDRHVFLADLDPGYSAHLLQLNATTLAFEGNIAYVPTPVGGSTCVLSRAGTEIAAYLGNSSLLYFDTMGVPLGQVPTQRPLGLLRVSADGHWFVATVGVPTTGMDLGVIRTTTVTPLGPSPVTAQTTPSIKARIVTFEPPPGIIASFTLDGVPERWASPSADGTVEVTPTAPLVESNHIVQLRVLSGSTQVAMATWQFAVDVTPPRVIFDLLPDPVHVDDVTISGTVVEAHLAYLTIGGQRVYVNGAGSFSLDQKLQPGNNTFDVVAVDRAGNRAETNLTIDFMPVPSWFVHPAKHFHILVPYGWVATGNLTLNGQQIDVIIRRPFSVTNVVVTSETRNLKGTPGEARALLQQALDNLSSLEGFQVLQGVTNTTVDNHTTATAIITWEPSTYSVVQQLYVILGPERGMDWAMVGTVYGWQKTDLDPELLATLASLRIDYLDQPPVADFTFTPATATVFTALAFNSTSFDPDGKISRWSWDFGDAVTSNLPNPLHGYTTKGPKVVTLTVTDDQGNHATVTHVIQVLNLPPSANFSYDPTNVAAGDVVHFTDRSRDLDGTIVSDTWDFGDGTRSTERAPDHAFGGPGKYTVTLTVKDDDGATGVLRLTIAVAQRSWVYWAGSIGPLPVLPLAIVGLTSAAAVAGVMIRRRRVEPPLEPPPPPPPPPPP